MSSCFSEDDPGSLPPGTWNLVATGCQASESAAQTHGKNSCDDDVVRIFHHGQSARLLHMPEIDQVVANPRPLGLSHKYWQFSLVVWCRQREHPEGRCCKRL